jgi:DNA-binding transcriptional regulator/RsmH inhibitor MraZ
MQGLYPATIKKTRLQIPAAIRMEGNLETEIMAFPSAGIQGLELINQSLFESHKERRSSLPPGPLRDKVMGYLSKSCSLSYDLKGRITLPPCLAEGILKIEGEAEVFFMMIGIGNALLLASEPSPQIFKILKNGCLWGRR